MIDDIFVFDAVIHAYDARPTNVRDTWQSRHGIDYMMGFAEMCHWPSGDGANDTDYRKEWSPLELHDMVFVDSPIDMAVAMVVPLFDYTDTFFAPVDRQYAMAKAYPEKVLFCGGVDPNYHNLGDALDQIDFQAKELAACSFKFYNGHYDRSWRCDDKEIAYPMYERVRSNGIRTIQFHKGLPLGTQTVEPLSPLDLQLAARDFPDMNFLVHHLAQPPLNYFEELLSVASRFPNVYVGISGNLNLLHIAPRLVQKQIGKLLQEVGAEKLVYGSEAALAGSPGEVLKAFMKMEIPEDLRVGYGYPQLTTEDRKLILGRNLSKLLDVDIDAKQKELAGVMS